MSVERYTVEDQPQDQGASCGPGSREPDPQAVPALTGFDPSRECERGIEQAIRDFRNNLPGWWYSLGECEVSCDASCAPTRESGDIALIPHDERFNSGFHVDLLQPCTLAAALWHVMGEAVAARIEAKEAAND